MDGVGRVVLPHPGETSGTVLVPVAYHPVDDSSKESGFAMNRRAFLALPALLPFSHFVKNSLDLISFERRRVLRLANAYLSQQPITITSSSSPRSAGGKHDYFSEGDYWWPDPRNPDGPYIQRDGMTNPDNFTDHRRALIRLSLHVPALVAAWIIARDRRYAEHAVRHLRAWFLNDHTRMNPSLLFAQAIKGRVTGRGTGIIDTIHLVEVVRAISRLEKGRVLAASEREGLRDWFRSYLAWMTTHPYGIEERDARNNHATCWVMQVAEFARYAGKGDLVEMCRDRYKNVLLPGQVAENGSFHEELRRTKPYGYSLFNLDAMTAVCQILSTRGDNLWTWRLSDGRGIARALEFMFPFIADKSRWPHQPDVMYYEQWPVRHPSLLFGGLGLNRPSYIEVWRRLKPDPTVDETTRNYFIRQPVLWLR
ncbi:MAG TPA: alginate lyase family protein [Blastocatellia bacterium]|nr:alginate lyase family protein [Blastocatellia bacterium]